MAVKFCSSTYIQCKTGVDNGMKLNLDKTIIISFARKTNSIYSNYKLCKNLVSRSRCVKDLDAVLNCKLCFASIVTIYFLKVVVGFDSVHYVFLFHS
jgi:hypothetical protein